MKENIYLRPTLLGSTINLERLFFGPSHIFFAELWDNLQREPYIPSERNSQKWLLNAFFKCFYVEPENCTIRD